ncbi:contact-dependent growth inhibition system immunity protein [Paraburkholderia antibiotica]|uniref:CdiI immunity protein domain-containing protein n=1 Tax=Paraburkholderia antibiotica TaxID=2728839 RepID=A0A7X9X2W2_9BURK|nr:contact-dependent growth inhibition system immunity protein [Paraburkholderia antibiotica]NML30448.1 hypothetical protein [Paraburkholderia antibiotica]
MNYLERYPEMEQFFCAYFGQDFDLFGNTVSEIVECYKKGCPHNYGDVIREIELFRNEHPNDLATAFEENFLSAFTPEPWGYTILSFLDEVERLLRE